MVAYIKNKNEGIEILDIYGKVVFIRSSLNSYLIKKCKNSFINLIEYRKVIKKITNLKYNIPIVISKKEVYFLTSSIRNFDCYIINLKSVIAIYQRKKDELIFLFSFGKTLEIRINSKKIKNIFKAITTIEQYKNYLI